MSADVRVDHWVAFADGPGGGNPCPVVRGADGWSDAEMQAAAAELGHETCFVLAPSGGADAVVRLRYFVPRHEMEMCVHATVAASVALGLEDGAGVETPLGVRRVWRPSAGAALVEQFAPEVGPVVEDVDAVAAVLGGARPVAEVRSVSTARAKLLVGLADEATLDGLAPDFEALWTLCDLLGTTGIYAYTLNARDADVAARQFPVRAGFDEDPATGVAACALGAWLAGAGDGWHRLRVAQGRAMGRPSLIDAEALRADGAVVATRVGGEAAPAAP
ncbi:putative isomerase YddE [Baekduia alba]|uniref:PhzF family phenazine biosynthesis protein n=1 Tax=Baekduia alba TaxID=2997333 RepID=UPI00233F7F43|nr:PhzF family phenazine biosynthesis isomerase [Baekduia alba]WCB95909.1 putative isomerase YddE [Baekduia alba]